MIALLVQHEKEIAEICKTLRIYRLEVFGSGASGDFNHSRSDLDFIVEFGNPDEEPGLLNRYLSLAEQLEKTFGRKIDLLTRNSIRNVFFQRSVDMSRELIYEDRNIQIPA